jgi:hypothetical protein
MLYICINIKTIKMNNKQIECSFCGHLNHINNIRCEGYDCGVPLDLDIEYQTFNGLPNITNKQ